MPKKNILLLFSDQHRGDWLPLNGNFLSDILPNIKNLIETGVTFENCITPSPLCAPARACLALGQDYDNCGTYNNKFCMPVERKTIYSNARDNGYLVGNSGKLDLHKPCLFWNSDGWIDQLGQIGFTDAVDSEGKWDTLWASYEKANGPYGGYLRKNNLMMEYAKDYTKRFFNPMTTDTTGLPDCAYADNFVTDNALVILDKFLSSGKPWFFSVNFSGPHDPWDITDSMKESTASLDFGCDDESLQRIKRNYAAMLENIDKNIGIIIDKVREKGQLDNTIIIYSADHGEMLGDRGMYYKSKPYNASIHIPLIISGPGILKDKKYSCPVQLQDLSATIASWCGCSLGEKIEGRSLSGLCTGTDTKPVRDYQISKLSKTVENSDSFAGYEEYRQFKKTKSDKEFFSKICYDLDIPFQDIPPVNKENIPDWACVIAENYKLVIYANGKKELYSTDDKYENNDLYESRKDFAASLEKKYNLSIFSDKR